MWPVYGAVLEQQFENRLSADDIQALENILKKLG
jgi:hypothetical protein